MTATVPAPEPWTAGDLIAAGRCTAQCLLAVNGKCDCPCNGRWHGALTAVEIGEPRVPWYARHCGYSQAVPDRLCPATSSRETEIHRHYMAAVRSHTVFAVAKRYGKTWETRVDVSTAWGPENGYERLTDEAADLWEAILVALIRARRAKSGSGGRELLFAYRVQTQVEAQVLGALAVELHAGNPDGARSCLRALAEDGFARPCDVVTR